MSSLTIRPYGCEEDYSRIRDFLRRVYLLNGRHEHSWPVQRLDYWRWHVVPNCGAPGVEESTWLWETRSGEIAAILNSENRGEAHLQVSPVHRLPDLEHEMLETAEGELFKSSSNGKKTLGIWCGVDDRVRFRVLTQRGYSRTGIMEWKRSRDLAGSVPFSHVPGGFTIRELGGEEEIPSRSWASWRAFHPESPDSDYQGWEWYECIRRMPLYRADLDLVAVAPDGEVAGFCTIWLDELTGSGYFEPVGRRPEYEKHGLMRSLLLEGMTRLRELGATQATIGGSSFAANVLYASVTDAGSCDSYEQWRKVWQHEEGATRRCRQ
ncbi:GNAT family N-acetyltransferase [Candidatus Fermentibacterales bacterium]|nr:GNAT family N-acetyltransferase [Candidatus Fermentibacterales bacterium]